MKVAVKRLIRNEKGQAMLLALILLLIGGLTSASLLGYMGTGLLTGEVYETRTAELYAADAGVEDAMWKIQHPGEAGYLPCSPGSPPRVYNITDVNGKDVQVSIESVYSVEDLTFIYRVVSTATGDGSGTQIDAYVNGVNKYGDYTGILGNVITSPGEIDLPPHWEDYVHPSEGENAPEEGYMGEWPDEPEEVSELADFYWQQVKNATQHYDGDTTINLEDGDMELGPAYVLGTLTIENSNSKATRTLTLTGTLYIKGDTVINPTQEMIIDLNGQTIFVESSSFNPPKYALSIGAGGGQTPKIKLIGSGVIAAVGDIYFRPNTQAGVTDPIFVMSVLGETQLQPVGAFYGCVAGKVMVDLQPGTSINYPNEAGWYDDLNFLTGIKKLAYSIDSWEVSPQ
jgi:hypothetical protein